MSETGNPINPVMNRYTVEIHRSSDQSLKLIVPFSPTSKISLLLQEVSKRASRQGLVFDSNDACVRLDNATGPIMDNDDTLEQTIISPKDEVVFVCFNEEANKAGPKDPRPSEESPITKPKDVCLHPLRGKRRLTVGEDQDQGQPACVHRSAGLQDPDD